MITILYAILESLYYLKSYKACNRKLKIKTILQLIVAICLGIGYCVWFGVIIVNEHLFDPSQVVSLIMAQEAVISGALASVIAAINKKVNRVDGYSNEQGDQEEDEINSQDDIEQ